MIGIPTPSLMAARLVAVALALSAAGFVGWTVQGWRMRTQVADVKLKAAVRESDAVSASLARYKTIRDAHDHEAASLAMIDALNTDELERLRHENEALRGGVDSGAVRLRVAAHCPTRTADVPASGARGGVDSGPGAELDAAARQSYFALRDGIALAGRQLAACQQSLGCITGQTACPAGSPR